MKIVVLFVIFLCFSAQIGHGKYFNRAPYSHEKSLAIVFDVSGSMSSDMDNMKAAAKKVFSDFTSNENNAIYNYILVPFSDPFDEKKRTITTDSSKLLKSLNDLYPMPSKDNSDCPEPTLAGLKSALEHVLDKSYVFVFSDATALDYELVNEVIALIERKQTTVN